MARPTMPDDTKDSTMNDALETKTMQPKASPEKNSKPMRVRTGARAGLRIGTRGLGFNEDYIQTLR